MDASTGQPGYRAPPAGLAPPQGGYPPPAGQAPPQGEYPPPAGQAPPQGVYPPPAGQAPPQGGYLPPVGQAPPQGGYPPPAGQAPPQGGYPHPAGQAPQGAPAPMGPAGWDSTMLDQGPAPTVLGGHGNQHGPGAALPGAGDEPLASAPPLDKMDTIQGYTDVGFDGTQAPPPSYNEVMSGTQPTREPPRDVPVITEDQARDALIQFVSEHCCFGKKPAQKLNFTDLKSTSAFHYTLETFTEARTTAWAYEPYQGQVVDGPMNGHAPGPWDIQLTPVSKFKDQKQHAEIPHTASVKPCHQCYGNGRVRCNHCHGHGRTQCHRCHGQGRESYHTEGRQEHRTCTSCHGEGRNRCTRCHGHGHQQCPTCKGRSQLKCYIQLTVQWKNNLEDHIVERTNLPDKLIRTVTGQTAFEEELPWVWPINHFPDQSINQASNQLVQRHRTGFPNQRSLMQRHRVRIVPVTEVHTVHDSKPFVYFVYGFEHKVHAPDYPSQCCCGCTIL